MVSKLQERIPEVTSWRQNSLAAAGVAIATNASANKVVAAVAVIFKNCCIFFPVSSLQPPNSRWDSGNIGAIGAEK